MSTPYLQKPEVVPQPEAYLPQEFFRPMGAFYGPQMFTEGLGYDSILTGDPGQLQARIQRLAPHLFVPQPQPETPVPLAQSTVHLL